MESGGDQHGVDPGCGRECQIVVTADSAAGQQLHLGDSFRQLMAQRQGRNSVADADAGEVQDEQGGCSFRRGPQRDFDRGQADPGGFRRDQWAAGEKVEAEHQLLRGAGGRQFRQ